MQRFAQRHQLTQNTLVQGAWALLLSSLSRREDVVFGVVVSGRSAQVAEVESMVGLFINTLPARATITADAELTVWLKQLQAQQTEISQYEYSPLARVQAWSEVEPGTTALREHLRFRELSRECDRRPWRSSCGKCQLCREIKLSAHRVGDTGSRVSAEDWIRQATLS